MTIDEKIVLGELAAVEASGLSPQIKLMHLFKDRPAQSHTLFDRYGEPMGWYNADTDGDRMRITFCEDEPYTLLETRFERFGRNTRVTYFKLETDDHNEIFCTSDPCDYKTHMKGLKAAELYSHLIASFVMNSIRAQTVIPIMFYPSAENRTPPEQP